MNATHDTALCARFFTRQPIFDAKRRTWGYALAFGRAVAGECDVQADELDTDDGGLDATAGMLSLADALFGLGRKVMISFGERSILDETPYALPPERTVIEVPGCDALPASAAVPLQEFRRDGFCIALDLAEAARAEAAVRAAADYLVLDLGGVSRDAARKLLDGAPGGQARLLARGVHGAAELELARDLGFELFQGGFFQAPDTLSPRRPTSHETSRFKLLSGIEQPDPDFDQLTEAIQHDAAISYRLLSYLNSPAFGFTDRITSIRQAMVLLGWKLLKSWLRVVIMTDLSPDPQTRQLLLQSVQRGKFFELAAASQPELRDDPDEVFLLGLFSLLEPLLHVPMRTLAEHLPLTGDLVSALTDAAPGRCTDWLELARAYEGAQWGRLDGLIDALGLHPLTVSVAYYKSVMWTETFFSHS